MALTGGLTGEFEKKTFYIVQVSTSPMTWLIVMQLVITRSLEERVMPLEIMMSGCQ